MNKLLVSLTMAVVLMVLLTTPVMAKRSGLDIVSVNYNRDAGPNENTVEVIHSSGRVNTIKGNEFIASPELPTIAELEEAIYVSMQERYESWERLSLIDKDDEARQDPPVLTPNQRIDYIGNKAYLVDTILYFGIHIYSLDNIETPENELSFTTRFSNLPIIGEWW